MTTRSEYQTLLKDWDKTSRLRSSLERYRDILGSNEVATEDLTYVMNVALENIDPEFDIKEGSTITLRAIKEALVASAKIAWEILKKVYQYLNALYVRFTGSIRKVRANQERTMRRLGALGSRASNVSNISVAGVQRLSVDGRFAGTSLDSLQDIKDITNYTLNVYPRSVTQISRNCSRQFLNLLDRADGSNTEEIKRDILEQFASIFSHNFREPPGAKAVSNGEVTGNFKSLKRGTELVGNTAFVYVDPKEITSVVTNAKADTAQVVAKSMYMNFQELSLNVADRAEREIDLPTVRELTRLITEIANILTLAEKAESGRRDFATVKTVVDDSIRQAMERTDNRDLIPVTELVMTISGELSKKLAEPMDNFMHWLAITLNVWINFIGHCIDHYETEGI